MDNWRNCKSDYIKKIKLPGGSTYSSFEVTGAGKANTGKYSTVICVGHRVDKNNKLEEQKYFVMHPFQMAMNIPLCKLEMKLILMQE